MSEPQPYFASAPMTLSIGELTIQLAYRGNAFEGIGDVRTRSGCLLRSGLRPMSAQIRSPDGVELVDWRLVSTMSDDRGGVELLLHCDRRDGGPMEYMLHAVRPRLNTADWSQLTREATGTTLRLRLWPVERRIGERRFAGFGYQYHYDSPDIAIYKILDRATWEPGGRATGNEIWLRGAEPAVYRIESPDAFYSSEWYLPGIANPNIFQFKPLQTHLQGFTFTAGQEGVLVTWASRVHHIRTLLQKDRGSDQIIHLHESCGDLSLSLASAPMEVLFWESDTSDAVALANCYEDVRELVHQELHDQVGMRRERITTTGMIEQWHVPDMDRYTDAGLSALAEVGVKTIEIANHFQNNMNVYGVANMCCTVDLKVADSVGEGKLQRFCAVANERGMRVRMWGNTALSTISSIFLESSPPDERVKHPIRLLPEKDSKAYRVMRSRDALVRDPTGSVDADHYRPRFAVMNLRDPGVRAYWLDAWRDAHDRIGIGGIFLDSSFNLSSDKHHWSQNAVASTAGGATADQAHLLVFQRPASEPRPAILSQYHAHLKLIVEMQQMGYTYCAEDSGVFGVHRAGWNLVANRTRLHLWADSYQNFDAVAVRSAGADPDAVFLEGLAYRVMWLIHWDPVKGRLSFNQSGFRSDADAPSEAHLRLIRLYNDVEPWMQRRTILPGGKAIVYHADEVMVVWTLGEVTIPLPPGQHRVDDLTTGRSAALHGAVHAAGARVLRVSLNAIETAPSVSVSVSPAIKQNWQDPGLVRRP